MTETSKRGSFKGYRLKSWIKKNKGSLKTIITLLLALIGTSFASTPIMAVLFGSASAVGTRIILDTVDFFISEVTIN